MQTCKVHAKLKSLLPLRSQVQQLLLKQFLDRHLPAVKLLGKFLFSYKSQKNHLSEMESNDIGKQHLAWITQCLKIPQKSLIIYLWTMVLICIFSFSAWQGVVFSHNTIYTMHTVFQNHRKCRIWILAFSTNFCPIKTDLSGKNSWPQASGFQKLTIFDIFN